QALSSFAPPYIRESNVTFACLQRFCQAVAGVGTVTVPRSQIIGNLTDPATAANTPEGAIQGNRQSKIYHLPSCPNYATVTDKNVVLFATEVNARKAGYRKAKNCP